MLASILLYVALLTPPDTPKTYTLPRLLVDEQGVAYKIPKNPCDNIRLERKIRKVLPVAKRAGEELLSLNQQLAVLPEREHKKLVSATEQRLRIEFTKELEEMTTSEGILLVKLLDRECGKNGYDIVKELRSNFIAWGFQNVARLFGQNLKDEWDPDKMICEEFIIQKIEWESKKNKP